MVFNLIINKTVVKKLFNKHAVARSEVEECFMNRNKGLLEDMREQNKTHPPTQWFIAETNEGRLLKIVFVALRDEKYEIKTAYEPNDMEIKIYEKYA